MSTRSITVVTSQWEGEDTSKSHHATIYRHSDGYLSGHGAWLAEFLADAVVTNGRENQPKHFNGAGELASGIVAGMFQDDLNPNLEREGVTMGQEYQYHVHVKDFGFDGGTIEVTVFDGPMTAFGYGGGECANEIFRGSVEEYATFIASNPDG